MSRYPNLSNELYSGNRKKLASKLPLNSIAILSSNKRFLANADDHYPLRQNSDFLYLTGIYAPNCTLVIGKNVKGSTYESLFIPKISKKQIIWDGDGLSSDTASLLSGVENVQYSHEFLNWIRASATSSTSFHLSLRKAQNPASVLDLKRKVRKHFAANPIESLSPLLNSLRSVKRDEEIEAIESAIEITRGGLELIVPLIREGMREFQLEAELLRYFLDRSSRGFAFDPIIASGSNSTVLHYNGNGDTLAAGELLLMDVGAEYGGYNADITRVYPVGKYSKRQQEVVNAVDRIVESSISYYRPGTSINAINKQVAKQVEQELLQLGLISSGEVKKQHADNPAYRRYYMHSATHFLGIDVHDVGGRDDVLKPGMVLTLEPGIYIREEGIGVRLEEDILITKKGNRVLSAGIPRQA